MKKLFLSILTLSFSILLTFSSGLGKDQKNTTPGTLTAHKKKVLIINSYHEGYAWSDGVESGIAGVLKEHPEIEYKFHRMDTKRNNSKDALQEAAIKAKKLIELWKPDVVIVSDDNASKYLIVPYFKNAELPIVFCGVNWDVTPYGYPFKNVTGMVEVALMDDLVTTLRRYSRGSRIGLLGPDVTSARQDANYYKGNLEIKIAVEKYVQTFSEWKAAYIQIQEEVDILILPAWEGTKNWDDREAADFILEHMKIPSGGEIALMAKHVLATFAKDPAEQGEWSAHTALEIIGGKKPAEIPIVTNRKAKVILNMKHARKLGVKFPMELIERATFVGEGVL